MLRPAAVNPREGSTSPAHVQNAGPGEPATPAASCGGGVHVSVQRVRAVSLPTAGLPLERQCELRWEAAGGSQRAGPCCSQAHASSPGESLRRGLGWVPQGSLIPWPTSLQKRAVTSSLTSGSLFPGYCGAGSLSILPHFQSLLAPLFHPWPLSFYKMRKTSFCRGIGLRIHAVIAHTHNFHI